MEKKHNEIREKKIKSFQKVKRTYRRRFVGSAHRENIKNFIKH